MQSPEDISNVVNTLDFDKEKLKRTFEHFKAQYNLDVELGDIVHVKNTWSENAGHYITYGRILNLKDKSLEWAKLTPVIYQNWVCVSDNRCLKGHTSVLYLSKSDFEPIKN